MFVNSWHPVFCVASVFWVGCPSFLPSFRSSFRPSLPGVLFDNLCHDFVCGCNSSSYNFVSFTHHRLGLYVGFHIAWNAGLSFNPSQLHLIGGDYVPDCLNGYFCQFIRHFCLIESLQGILAVGKYCYVPVPHFLFRNVFACTVNCVDFCLYGCAFA